jgi:transposase
MEETIDRNKALYVGIDVHRYEHTAVCANRFEEEKGYLSFPNTETGIDRFINWLASIDDSRLTRIIGVEGSNGNGRLLTSSLAGKYPEIYEINPLRTKQRRTFGTRGNKSDTVDARLIVEVLTRKLDELPKITLQDHSEEMETLEQLVIFHDDLTFQTSRLKNQLHLLFHEIDPEYQPRRGSSFSVKSLDDWLKKCGRKVILTDPKNIRYFMAVEKIRQLRRLKRTIKRADQEMESFVNKIKPNLLTFPGVGITTAGKIIVAARGIERFRLDTFIKYAGIAPVEKQSGKNKKHKQNKTGNRQLNNAIYTVALTQLRCHLKAKAYFQKKIAEGKTKKHAIRCLMKRIACILYGLLRTNGNYRG